MYRKSSFAAALAVLLALAQFALAQDKIVAYVPNWVDLKSFSETIDYPRLTHINIAFENPTGNAFRKRDYPYSAIVRDYPSAENADQIGDTIWYNGIPTIKAKTNYVIDQKLAGVMIWSLDNDVKGEKSLLGAIAETYRARRAAPHP